MTATSRASVTALLVAAALSALAGQGPRRTLLLRFDQFPERELGRGLFTVDEYRRDVVVSLVDGTLLLLATDAERQVFEERGFRFAVVARDTNPLVLYRRAIYGPTMTMPQRYHTTARIADVIDSLARARPGLARKIVIGRTTQARREIPALKLSNDPRRELDRPRFLFNGCHHADEVMGAEVCIALARELLRAYDSDPEVRGWLGSYEIYIVPVVNVDGHEVVTSGRDPRWRKNTRDTNGNGVLLDYPEGVDINRNYDFNWAHGGSDDSLSERYRGAYPFSESEAAAVRDLALSRRFLLSISYHSQGEVVYYPWDWRGRRAPEDSLLTAIARGLAGSIRTMAGDSAYRAEYGAGTVGQSYPWLYGAVGTFDFVVETGRGTHIFPPEAVDGIVRANLDGARYLLRRGAGPGLTGLVRDARTGAPLDATVWLPTIETEDLRRRTTEPGTGRFRRLLAPGSYTVMVFKDGYRPALHRAVAVAREGWTTLDIALQTQ